MTRPKDKHHLEALIDSWPRWSETVGPFPNTFFWRSPPSITLGGRWSPTSPFPGAGAASVRALGWITPFVGRPSHGHAPQVASTRPPSPRPGTHPSWT